MLFSYYFDTKKTHLLNCSFDVLQFAEKAEGVIEIMFSAEISEWRNNVRSRQEKKVGTFQFPPLRAGEDKHDIDFTRVRYGDEKKWIFTVINNKDNTQKIEVGLISSTANKNPLGLDVSHDSEEFNADLKGNNLSILENTYIPPVLNQTVAETSFATAGYPERFNSDTAIYDSTYQNQVVNDFRQDFLDPVPSETPFTIEVDIAPKDVNPYDGNKVFDFILPFLGTVSAYQTYLQFVKHEGTSADVVQEVFDTTMEPSQFFNNGMTPQAKLVIKGDGEGYVTVKYNDKTLVAEYDATNEFSYIDFRGEFAGDEEADPKDAKNWLPSRIDNIAVTYRK
jgi:hypothetical protein